MRRIKGVSTTRMREAIGEQNVARADAVPIDSYGQLVREIAHLAYLNKDYLLFFRGQAQDYRNKADSSTIYPTIYRGDRVSRDHLRHEFDVLASSASRLSAAFEAEGLPGYRDVRRRRYVQWSILQHYEVCPTPLLDLTQSLLVACSFAYLDREDDEPFIFVFGLPYQTNRISIDSEHDLVTVRLLSICPPEAVRPYFQEGYLSGTDDIQAEFDSKSELDFKNRLLGKFRLAGNEESFWVDSSVRPHGRQALYPEADRVREMCESIRSDVAVTASEESIGRFLRDWGILESYILQMARRRGSDRSVRSARAAIASLAEAEFISSDMARALHEVKRVRDNVVHQPGKVGNRAVARAGARIRGLMLDVRGVDDQAM